MKSSLYFLLLIIISFFTTIPLQNKENSKPISYYCSPPKSDCEITKKEAKKLLNCFVKNTKEIDTNINITKKNLEIAKLNETN